MHVGRRALDLDHVDAARRLDPASSSYGSAVHSSPPILTRPRSARLSSSSTSALLADQRVGPGPASGPCAAASRRSGRTNASSATDVIRAARTWTATGRPSSAVTHADDGADREHDQDQVEADQLQPPRAATARTSQVCPQVLAGTSPCSEPIQGHSPAARRVRRRARAVQRPSSWRRVSGIPKVVGERPPRSSPRSSGPAATTRPSRSISAWVKPGGISSTWWETSTVAGDVSSMREHRQRRDQVLAAAEVEPGGGLVEDQQLGVGHQRPGDLHPLALALAEGAEGAVGEVAGADLARAGRRRGRGRARRSARASARPRRTTRRPPRRAPARRAGCARRARRWSSPIRGRSSKTSTVPSTSPRMPATPDGRVDLRRADLDQRGLAGAVGTEDDPALVLLDRPVDAVEQGRRPAPDGDVGELENGIHAGYLVGRRVPGSAVGGAPTYTAAYPRRVTATPAPRCRPRVRPVVHRLAGAGRRAWTTPATPSSATTPRTSSSGCRRRPTALAADRRARACCAAAGADRRRARAPVPGRPARAWPGRAASTPSASRPARPWSSRRRLGLVPHRAAPASCGRATTPSAAARCPTVARPTGRCARPLARPPTAGRPRRRPLAAGDRRPADEPAPPADAAAPAGDGAARGGDLDAGDCGAATIVELALRGRRRRVTARTRSSAPPRRPGARSTALPDAPWSAACSRTRRATR